MIGNSASLAECPLVEEVTLKTCREIARKHLDKDIRSLFHEIAGVELQVTWLSKWSHHWSDGDLSAVRSCCHRHAGATLAPGGGGGHNDADSNHLDGAPNPRHRPNFSTSEPGFLLQWHPMMVRGRTLGFLFIQTIDKSGNIPDDTIMEPAGDRMVKSLESTFCPPTAVGARLDTIQRERAGMLLKLVATHVESATLAELNEAALSKARLEALVPGSQNNSWQHTAPQRVPDLPAKGKEDQACPHRQQIVQRMLDYLQSHYQRPIQLADVAKALKMNTCYLSSLFSATTGVTYRRYLEGLRLARAKELLADPVMNICEVASATGYTSSATFCRTFKARTGLSPRAWRDGDHAATDHSSH